MSANTIPQTALGTTLKRLRELQGFTLRHVEEATNISNAYLSQLENDKIKKPSANVLYKLSCIYRVPIDTLLIAAGIIKPEERIFNDNGAVSFSHPVTPEEEKQLIEYLNFLRSQNSKP